jgi:hypothetical protein
MRMPVVLGGARAGRRTESQEHNKGSEGANLTARSEATNGRVEVQRQNGRTPEFYSQLLPVALPSCER